MDEEIYCITHLVGHKHISLVLLDVTRLDLADNDSTHVLVLFSNGKHERSIELTIQGLHVVKILQQRGTFEPRALVTNAILDVGASVTTDRNEHDIVLGMVASLLQERSQLAENFIIAIKIKS